MAPNQVLSDKQARELLRRQRGDVPSIEEQRREPVGLEKELAQLRELITKHGRKAYPVRMLITVNMAHAMLHLMGSGNRRISRAWVERWKMVILEDRWEENPSQGMGFDWNGHFRDGQHRATAVIETKKAIYQWVSFGVDPKAYAANDTGNRRNAAQNLELAGVTRASHVGAIVRLRYRTEHSGTMPDDQLVFDLGQKMAGDVLDRAIEGAFKLRADRGATVSSAALAYWLISTKSEHRDRLEKFWEHLVEGYDLPKDGTIWNLRRKFRTLPAGRKAHQYRSQTEQCGWIIKAWNAWVDDEVLTQNAIRWPSEHKLPEVM